MWISLLYNNCIYDDNITTLQSNFQAGVNSVYNAVVAKGVTPASYSLSDIVTGISNISTGMPEFYKAAKGWTQGGHPTITITFDNPGKYAVIFTSADYNSGANAIGVYAVPKLITGALTASGCTYKASSNNDYYLVNATSKGATLKFSRGASNISVVGYIAWKI